MALISRRKRQPYNARLKVGFILSRRFTLSAFANFIDVLRLAADTEDQSRQIYCQWSILSDRMRPIVSSSGVQVRPDEKMDDPTKFTYIVVVGGLMDSIYELPASYTAFLRQAAQKGIPIIGLCTGVFILSKAGLMDGYKCCVSWFHHHDYQAEFNNIIPITDQIYVVDRDRLTCSGGVSTAHLAAYLIDKHLGQSQALKSLHILMINKARDQSFPQPGTPLDFKSTDPIVKKALLLMQQTMDAPLSINRIAQRIEVNRKRLERHFQKALNMTPTYAYKYIRLDHARHLLGTTDDTIADIAAQTGFCDSSHFIKLFKDRNFLTPLQFRESFKQ